MSLTGRLVEFDPDTECGYIEPDDGSTWVFVHADELGGRRQAIVGTPVRFSRIQGSHGLKAYNVSVLAARANWLDPSGARDGTDNPAATDRGTADGLQPISGDAYAEEIAAALCSAVPGISPAQISRACRLLATPAARRGWLAAAREQSA